MYGEYTLYKLLETSSAILCTHTIQLICSPTRENGSSFSSQAGPESRRTWERTVDRPSYNAVGEALKPSAASIPLFPGFPRLGRRREAAPPRGASVDAAEATARLATNLSVGLAL